MDLQTVGEFELAEQALRRAVDLSEGKPADRRKARFNLATVLVKLGRDDQAVPLLKDVVDADPEEVEARVELGDSYLRTGDYEQAVQVLQEAVSSGCQKQAGAPALGQGLHPAGPPRGGRPALPGLSGAGGRVSGDGGVRGRFNSLRIVEESCRLDFCLQTRRR